MIHCSCLVARLRGERPTLGRRPTLIAAGFTCLSMAWYPLAQDGSPVLERYELSVGSGVHLALPAALREVSGLATTRDGRLLAHNDEQGVVYQVDPGTGEIIKAFSIGTLGMRGDFEGIAVAGERIFLLDSGGRLVEFREGGSGSSVGYRIHSLELNNTCELEGLAFDEEAQTLLLPCKTPRARNLRNHLVIISVPINSMEPVATPRVFLPLEELDARGLGDEFHPSAIEIHPQTRSIVLLAAREEAMVELGPEGEILATRKLKKKQHPQPEGIAFLPDGSLVLADEGREGAGTLTRYALIPPPPGGDR